MSRARPLFFVPLLLLAEATAAVLVAQRPSYAVPLLCLCVGAVLLGLRGSALAVALPASFLAVRVGGGGLDLSIADAVVALLTPLALPFVDWGNRAVRRVVAVGALYLGMLVLNLVVTPTKQALFEWAHRWVLVVGAVLIGAALAATGRVALALRALLATALVFAVAAILFSVESGFKPAYVFGGHKNFVGPLLAMTLLALLAARSAFGISLLAAQSSSVVLALGLLATQSRASMIGLVVAAAAIWLRGRRNRLQVLLVAPLLVGLSIAAYLSLRASTTGVNDNQFNAVRTRQSAYSLAFEQFRVNPLTGAGIRWFKTPGKVTGEPHSALFGTLSETGLWGGLAVVLLFGGAWFVLRQSKSDVVTAALAVLLFRLVEGQFAIFWVAGTMTLPWLLVGIAAGSARAEAPTRTVLRPSGRENSPRDTLIPLARF